MVFIYVMTTCRKRHILFEWYASNWPVLWVNPFCLNYRSGCAMQLQLTIFMSFSDLVPLSCHSIEVSIGCSRRNCGFQLETNGAKVNLGFNKRCFLIAYTNNCMLNIQPENCKSVCCDADHIAAYRDFENRKFFWYTRTLLRKFHTVRLS